MNKGLEYYIKLFIIILWSITLVLLIVGLVFLFASFKDNELFTRVALSVAAMMSIISTAFTIYAMWKNKEFKKDRHDAKENEKYKLNNLNVKNKELFDEIQALSIAHNIELLGIEFIEFDNIEMAGHLNEELTIELSRVRNEIEQAKLTK